MCDQGFILSQDVCGTGAPVASTATAHPSFTETKYWGSINKINDSYKDKILSEKRLLLETHNGLQGENNSDISVFTGISVSRDFLPVVKLLDNVSRKYITFMVCDWVDFLDNLVAENETAEEYISENFKITYIHEPCTNIEIMAETGENLICLSADFLHELRPLLPLIEYRLMLLREMDFASFYDNSLEYISIQRPRCFEDDSLELLRNLCFLNTTVPSYCLLECLTFYKQKVLADLNKLRF